MFSKIGKFLLQNDLAWSIVVTGLGIAAIPYFVIASFQKSDYGGSGELGFIFGGIAVLVGIAGGAFLTIPAIFLGIPWYLSFPVGYYLTLLIGFSTMNRR